MRTGQLTHRAGSSDLCLSPSIRINRLGHVVCRCTKWPLRDHLKRSGPAGKSKLLKAQKPRFRTTEILFGLFACPMCRPSSQNWRANLQLGWSCHCLFELRFGRCALSLACSSKLRFISCRVLAARKTSSHGTGNFSSIPDN